MDLKLLTYVYFVSPRQTIYFRRQYCILVNGMLWNVSFGIKWAQFIFQVATFNNVILDKFSKFL